MKELRPTEGTVDSFFDLMLTLCMYLVNKRADGITWVI